MGKIQKIIDERDAEVKARIEKERAAAQLVPSQDFGRIQNGLGAALGGYGIDAKHVREKVLGLLAQSEMKFDSVEEFCAAAEDIGEWLLTGELTTEPPQSSPDNVEGDAPEPGDITWVAGTPFDSTTDLNPAIISDVEKYKDAMRPADANGSAEQQDSTETIRSEAEVI